MDKRAIDAVWFKLAGRSLSDTAIREALEAAIPFLPVQVAVKKLTWNEYSDEQGIPDRWDAEAAGFGVFYNIEMQHDGYRVVFDHEAVGAVGVFDTLEAAKAAAQADYEARILSALEPSAARELALEEAARLVEGRDTGIDTDFIQALSGRNIHEIAGVIAAHDFKLAAAIRALSSPDHADAGKVEGDGAVKVKSHQVNSGAFRRLDHSEWRDLGGDENPECDWHEGIGYVIYDEKARQEYLAKQERKS